MGFNSENIIYKYCESDKGSIQIYRVNFVDTYSPIVEIALV